MWLIVRDAWLTYRQPRVLIMLLFGFSAGLPFLLVFSTLSAWLRDVGIERATIGYFSWVGILFSIKVLWSPVVDQLRLPFLHRWFGQRRSWLLLAQAGIISALLLMTVTGPVGHLERFAWLALLVAFCSATQDICIDAYRIESAPEELQGAMAAGYIFGYRVAMLVAGAGAFYLAEYWSWALAYQGMALCMLVGVITTLAVSEPDIPPREFLSHGVAHWLHQSVVMPFMEFFNRYGRHALVLLLFISVYRISDITMGVMANPFYLDMGFSKDDIASVAKFFGFFMTIAGSAVGGVAVVRYGIPRPLLLGAVMVASTNILFAMMASSEPNLAWLALVISADNLSAGFANVCFIAYLSSLTSRQFTATQYALFSSLMTLPGKFVGGYSGVVVDEFGYPAFFSYAAILGIPAIVLAWYVWQQSAKRTVMAKADPAVDSNDPFVR
ncbi:MAG: AmpG family muropeptide MFS transporter [Alcanivoracaceae bacterium]|nr:AmpG family muropeptide MFS transporter [Alcanivoracaceae bacterium]